EACFLYPSSHSMQTAEKETAPALSRRESRRRLRLCMNISSGNVKSLYRRYRLEGSERKWKYRSSMTDRSPFCSILKNCKKKKLSRGLEPPTSALPRRRATDCAKTAYAYGFHTQGLIYTNHSELSREICYLSFRRIIPLR